MITDNKQDKIADKPDRTYPILIKGMNPDNKQDKVADKIYP